MVKFSKAGNVLIVFLFVITLVFSAVWTSPAHAQTPIAELSIFPEVSSATTTAGCNTQDIFVRVSNVENLQAYQVTVKWTSDIPNAIYVTSITDAGFMQNATNIIPPTIDNTTNTAAIYQTQLAGTPNTGTGNLVRIRFITLVPGATVDFTISPPPDTDLALPWSAPKIPHTRKGGRVITTGTGTCSTDTQLFFKASPARACVGDTITMDVWVANVINLWGYTINVVSDNPSAIAMTAVTNADFLDPGFTVPVLTSPGQIINAMTQLAPSTPKTGDGSLVRITMNVLQANKTVNFNFTMAGTNHTALSNSDIEYILFTPISGVIYTDDCAVPTSVNLLGFDGSSSAGAVNLTWETASETQNLGFNLYRANSPDGARVKINTKLIRSHGGAGNQIGSTYEYRDAPKAAGGVLGSILRQAKNGRPYFYWLEDIDVNGKAELHGPIEVKLAK